MPTLAAAGSVSSLLASLHALLKQFLALATVEGKQAGLRLLSILMLALLAAGLAITGWLALLAGIIVALVENKIVSWPVALGIAALVSFAGAGGLVLMLMQRSAKPFFAATRRQLGQRPEIAVNDGARPLVSHEQVVEEGRMAAQAEYQVVRQRLRHRLGSPVIIGGVVLAGIAVGYFVGGKRQPKNRLDSGRPSAWTQVLGSVQVLTPIWIALRIATRPPAAGTPISAPHAKGAGKATAGDRHES